MKRILHFLLFLIGLSDFVMGSPNQKEYFLSPLFVFNDTNHEIMYRYLVKNRHPITLFSIDNRSDEIYISEKYDNNGQNLMIKNDQIDFSHTQGVFQIDRYTWILISGFKFCGFYYKSNSCGEELEIRHCVKIMNQNKEFYLYKIKLRNEICFSEIYSHKLLCYQQIQLESYPEAYLEAHFYLDSPTTYLLKNHFSFTFFRLLIDELVKDKIVFFDIQKCNHPEPAMHHPR